MFEPGRKGDIREEARRQRNQRNTIFSRVKSFDLTVATVSANSSDDYVVTMPCSSSDMAIVNGPAPVDGTHYFARVTGKNEVTITFINYKPSDKTPTSGTYTVRVLR